MKIQIKEYNKETGKWRPVSAYKLLGQSLIDFMIDTEERIVAAAFDEEEKPVLFVSNNEKDTEAYKDKGASFSAQEIHKLLVTESLPKVSLEIIHGGYMLEAKSI